MRAILCGAVSICMFAAGSSAPGKDPQAAAKPPTEPKKLIEALANGNARPPEVKVTDRQVTTAPLYPENYDWKEERRVHAAFRALWGDNRDELWQLLAQNADDARYSFGWEIEDTDFYFNSVGRVCAFVAKAQLTVPLMECAQHCHPWSKLVSWDMGHGRELRDLKAWQKSHAGKPLYELQIEICRSGLKKVQDNNYFTPAQRKELARNVEKMIARLSADKKALVCDRWGGGESYHFIVGADAAKKYREMAEGAAPPGKD